MKFYRCEHCGNVITHFVDSGVPVVCCGEPMKELTANTTDAAVEKHVPVVKVEDNKVTVSVGSVEHPMTEAHYITLIVLETKNGTQFKQYSILVKVMKLLQLMITAIFMVYGKHKKSRNKFCFQDCSFEQSFLIL